MYLCNCGTCNNVCKCLHQCSYRLSVVVSVSIQQLLCKLCVVNLCLVHCCTTVLCNLLTLHSVAQSAQLFLCLLLCELCATGVCVAFANQNCKLHETVCKVCWRREPESNRPTRICNPVHNRFAIAPYREKREADASLSIWSGRRVSNSRPQPWQGCALPTELLPHEGQSIA